MIGKAARIRKDFETFGQMHIFAGFDTLDTRAQKRLVTQAGAVDLPHLNQLITSFVKSKWTPPDHRGELAIQPTPYIVRPENGGDRAKWASARRRGEAALRAGKVAAVTVAGGQGTRLGFDGPKGAFPITPVEGKPLFQVFAEKLLAAQERYGHPIMWLIMTSPVNHEATLAFFKQHNSFGLDPKQIHCFQQRQMPVVDLDGKILLEGSDTIVLSPDGHGGLFHALLHSGLLERLHSQGVEILSYFQVDNPLVHCIDPAFIGFHLEAGSDFSSKVILKTDPDEKVGLFCQRNGCLSIVEYSDLPSEQAAQRDPSGRLVHRTGNPAIHLLGRDFIEKIARDETLPFHRTEKKLTLFDAQGQLRSPNQPNAIKFERFLFDALPFANNPILVESDRNEEFSPVKNATGPTSPETCKEDQLRLFHRWMSAAGMDLPYKTEGRFPFPFEVSPLFATDQDTFVEKWRGLEPKPFLQEGSVLGNNTPLSTVPRKN